MSFIKLVREMDAGDVEWTDAPIMRGPADAAALVMDMADLAQEEMVLICMNTAGRMISREMIHRGGLASSIVEPRAIFMRAILSSAAAIILVHNHPSGNPEPSAEDIAVTRQVVEAGRVLGIPLRDHIIIAGKGWTSLAERGAV